jgi:hypothetical protein
MRMPGIVLLISVPLDLIIILTFYGQLYAKAGANSIRLRPGQPLRHYHVPKPLRRYWNHILKGLVIERHCHDNLLAPCAVSTGDMP